MSDQSSRIAYYLTRSKQIVRDEGIWNYLKKAMGRCKEAVYTTNEALWFCKDISEPIQDIHDVGEGNISIDMCPGEEIVTWLKEHHKDFRWLYIPEEISVKESDKHVYPVAIDDGKIVGYTKIGVNRVYITDYERIVPLPERTAMFYDIFVLPEYRGKSVALDLVSESIKFLHTEGYRNIWVHIPSWNKASIRVALKGGFKKVAHVRFVKIFGFGFCTRNVTKMMCSGTGSRTHGL